MVHMRFLLCLQPFTHYYIVASIQIYVNIVNSKFCSPVLLALFCFEPVRLR